MMTTQEVEEAKLLLRMIDLEPPALPEDLRELILSAIEECERLDTLIHACTIEHIEHMLMGSLVRHYRYMRCALLVHAYNEVQGTSWAPILSDMLDASTSPKLMVLALVYATR